MVIYCYEKCTTCKKAIKWLEEKGADFQVVDIKGQNPTKEQLKTWHEKSGLPIKRFFNTSGLIYRELELKDKLEKMSEDAKLDLLATNGMLVKRPLVIGEDYVLVGFKEVEWKEKI